MSSVYFLRVELCYSKIMNALLLDSNSTNPSAKRNVNTQQLHASTCDLFLPMTHSSHTQNEHKPTPNVSKCVSRQTEVDVDRSGSVVAPTPFPLQSCCIIRHPCVKSAGKWPRRLLCWWRSLSLWFARENISAASCCHHCYEGSQCHYFLSLLCFSPCIWGSFPL